MKAWRLHRFGEPADVLQLEEVKVPEPGPGEVLVRVRSATVNFPDVLLCRGTYQAKPPIPFTPGVELCGDVVAVGDGAGDVQSCRVVGVPLLHAGAFGELALMKPDQIFAAPGSLDDEEASAFHIAYQSGWFALHRRAALQRGEVLVVHAAAGGVGSAAIQLGKAAGATVIGVVGGQDKADVARRLGADVVVDRHRENFVSVVKEVTEGRGADVIFDPVGGESYRLSTKCVAFEGRILIIGFASGSIPAPGLNHALIKNYAVVGVHWGLYREHDLDSMRRAHSFLGELAEAGIVKPLVSERLPLAEAAAGVQRVADGHSVGKVAVVIP